MPLDSFYRLLMKCGRQKTTSQNYYNCITIAIREQFDKTITLPWSIIHLDLIYRVDTHSWIQNKWYCQNSIMFKSFRTIWPVFALKKTLFGIFSNRSIHHFENFLFCTLLLYMKFFDRHWHLLIGGIWSVQKCWLHNGIR